MLRRFAASSSHLAYWFVDWELTMGTSDLAVSIGELLYDATIT